MQRDTRTIGFVTTSFPRFDGDAAGSFVFGLARALSRRGHRVEVVAPEPQGLDSWSKDSGWLEGVRVFGTPYARPRALQRLFYGAGVPDNVAQNPLVAGLIPAAVGALARATAMHMKTWDAVFSHWLVPSALVAGFTRRWRGSVPHVGIAHSADVHLLQTVPFGGVLAGTILGQTDHLGFVSARLRQQFLSVLAPGQAESARAKSSVTPMGVDPTELVSPAARQTVRRRLKVTGFTVLYLGRLVPVKGVDLLLTAAADYGSVHIIVAGDGPLRAELERQARRQGVDACFLGWVDPAQRAELFRAVDAVAVPSRVLANGRQEGLPLVLIEALAAGVPVIASDTGAVSELVEHERSGLLIAPEDTAALADAMKRIARDRDFAHRLGRGGRARAAGRNWVQLVETYENLMQSQKDTT